MQGTEPWRKVSLAEGTASAKALRPDGVWFVRDSGRPAWLAVMGWGRGWKVSSEVAAPRCGVWGRGQDSGEQRAGEGHDGGCMATGCRSRFSVELVFSVARCVPDIRTQ